MQTSSHLLVDVAFIAGFLVAIAIWLRFRKPAKKRSKGGSAFGWVVLFLSSGRMPPPPPESQIEQEMQSRKNRQAADRDE